MTRTRTALVVALVAAAFALVASMEQTDHALQQQEACDMAALWHSDRERGIKPIDRRGYPIARSEWLACPQSQPEGVKP